MDITLDCGYCGKSWNYTDVDMPQAELITNNWEQHTHTAEELKAYHEAFSNEASAWPELDED